MSSRAREASTSLPTSSRSRGVRPRSSNGISTGFHFASRSARSGTTAIPASGSGPVGGAAGFFGGGAWAKTAAEERRAARTKRAGRRAGRGRGVAVGRAGRLQEGGGGARFGGDIAMVACEVGEPAEGLRPAVAKARLRVGRAERLQADRPPHHADWPDLFQPSTP